VQDLYLTLTTLLMLSAGFLAPFIMTLAYVWVDIFTPQLVSNGFLSGLPVALIFGGAAVATYLVKDRRDPPKINSVLILQLCLAVWITFTTFAIARNADAAYDKWINVIKVVLFAAFIPYAIRTRVQIEAFVLIYLLSISAHIIPWGVKTFLTGGGYGLSLGLLRSNTAMLAESSTVSTVGVMIVPLILVMRKNSLLLPKGRITNAASFGVIALGLVASVGTFARTGLVAAGVGFIAMWLRAKRKVLFTIMALIMGGIMFSVTSDKWDARISTVADYQNENSALVRVLVWQWTWNFAQSNPLGGGFLAFIGNRIEIPSADGGPATFQYSRAYHNMFFSVLGDHGFPGLGLYVGMLSAALVSLHRARKLTHKLPEHLWCAELAQAVQVSLITMMAGGFFVEIDWTPLVWYLVSMSVCLSQYALRVTARVLVDPYGRPLAGSQGGARAVLPEAAISGTLVPGTGRPGAASPARAGVPAQVPAMRRSFP
jgi:probable O-glycosylation ligase (exosortase A-associated)